MSDFISNLGQGLSKVLGAGGGRLVPALATGAGALSNYLTGRKTNQAISQQIAWDKYVQNLVSNPAAFQKFASGYTQPLTAGLTEGVENADQAWLAEHGLSQSPAIAGDVVNQSLAPYIQQQQNQGIQNALAALGYGGSKLAPQFAQGYGKGIDLTSLLKLLQGAKPGATGGTGTTAGGTHTTPTDIDPTLDPTVTAGGGVDWNSIPDMTVGDVAGGFGNVGVPQ